MEPDAVTTFSLTLIACVLASIVRMESVAARSQQVLLAPSTIIVLLIIVGGFPGEVARWCAVPAVISPTGTLFLTAAIIAHEEHQMFGAN